MEEIIFTEARNGLKLPIADLEAPLDREDTENGNYLVRNFFSEFWVLNTQQDVYNTPLNELVVPRSVDKPLLVFRSQLQSRHDRAIESDTARQLKLPDYDRIPVTTGIHSQSILSEPLPGSTQWETILAFQYNLTQGVYGSTTSYFSREDSLSAPSIEEMSQSWRELGNDEWRSAHKKAVKNLLLDVIELAS